MSTPDTPGPTRRVLVAYASRNGATAEIAEWLAARLRDGEKDFDVTVAEVSDALDPTGYDAVVLGSALYEGRWLPSASRFARRHRHDLAHAPVWTFSSGPLDDSASRGDMVTTHSADCASRGLRARDHVTFGGRLSPDSRGWLAHAMVDGGHGGDFRDRARIDAYAAQIAAELTGLPGLCRPAA
ncbi:flavodoxin domain-containing protein [Streptacidiphilus sp. MAP5-3]|uniref:flavodoxin domain-containing protein n=1 Tax=unclassified Streptacidiphilus TaxID=2643834 RepID=UPI0035159B79